MTNDSDDANGPGDDANGPDDDANGSGDDANGPDDDANGSGDDANGPDDDADDGTDAVAPSDAFAALGDPVRVDILEVLAEQYRDLTGDGGMPFAELRRSVGVEDSGRFRYHLELLRDIFVEQTDDGRYRLTYSGGEVATAIVAGTYTDSVTLGPTELDGDCDCGAAAVGRYEDGRLDVECADGHRLFVWYLPPNAGSGATVPSLVETATLDMYRTVAMARAGVCPDCYSPVDPTVERADRGSEPYRFRVRCGACGSELDAPVGCCLVGVPEVEVFNARHERSVGDRYWWEFDFAGEDAPVTELRDDPLRVAVATRAGDETLTVTVDGDGNVVETELTGRD